MASNTPLDRETLQAVRDFVGGMTPTIYDRAAIVSWLEGQIALATPAAPPRCDYHGDRPSSGCMTCNAHAAALAAPPRVETETEPVCAGPFVNAYDCPKCDPRRVKPEPAQDGARETRTLMRYGIAWDGPRLPIGTLMPDGYWTPWHIAQAEITRLQSALAQVDLFLADREALGRGNRMARLTALLAAAKTNDPKGDLGKAVSKLAQAEQERDKYRIAANVLCGAHIGIPQSRCPVCERDDARREAAALLARISGAL